MNNANNEPIRIPIDRLVVKKLVLATSVLRRTLINEGVKPRKVGEYSFLTIASDGNTVRCTVSTKSASFNLLTRVGAPSVIVSTSTKPMLKFGHAFLKSVVTRDEYALEVFEDKVCLVSGRTGLVMQALSDPDIPGIKDIKEAPYQVRVVIRTDKNFITNFLEDVGELEDDFVMIRVQPIGSKAIMHLELHNRRDINYFRKGMERRSDGLNYPEPIKHAQTEVPDVSVEDTLCAFFKTELLKAALLFVSDDELKLGFHFGKLWSTESAGDPARLVWYVLSASSLDETEYVYISPTLFP